MHIFEFRHQNLLAYWWPAKTYGCFKIKSLNLTSFAWASVLKKSSRQRFGSKLGRGYIVNLFNVVISATFYWIAKKIFFKLYVYATNGVLNLKIYCMYKKLIWLSKNGCANSIRSFSFIYLSKKGRSLSGRFFSRTRSTSDPFFIELPLVAVFLWKGSHRCSRSDGIEVIPFKI